MIMNDEQLLSIMELADEYICKQQELEILLKDGYVNLASAKFSKGFSMASDISPSSLPQEFSAKNCTQFSTSDDELVDGLTCKMCSISLVNTNEVDTKTKSSSDNTLRHRKNAKANVSKVESPEQQADEAFQKFLAKWLTVLPRGNLAKSQNSFTKATVLLMEIAELKYKMQSMVTDVKLAETE